MDSSSDITDDSKSESHDREPERTTKTATKNLPGSVAAPTRPAHDQRAATMSTQPEKEPRRSVSTASRRQSLGPLPSRKIALHGQSAAGRVNTSVAERPIKSRDVGGTSARYGKTGANIGETPVSTAESRSLSASRRCSLMRATASSLAKRCDNGTDNAEADDGHQQATAVSSASNFAASLTSKINKLVKGGSKSSATTTSLTVNKRLSLDASALPPRAGLKVPSTVGTTGVTSRPRDREAGRTSTSALSQSVNVCQGQGQGHGVASSVRGVRAGRGSVPGRGGVRPAALTKSSSTMSLRQNPGVKKSVR